MLAGKLPVFAASSDAAGGDAHHFTMIGDWGKPGDMTQQKAVAKGMTDYLAARKIKPDAMFFLGDNFYGKMNGGVKCTRFKTQFSEIYPKSVFPGLKFCGDDKWIAIVVLCFFFLVERGWRCFFFVVVVIAVALLVFFMTIITFSFFFKRRRRRRRR